MKDEVKRLGEELRGANLELADTVELIKKLEEKNNSASQQLVDLRAKLQAAKNLKEKTLRQWVTEAATQEEVEAVQAEIQTQTQAVCQLDEMIKATDSLKTDSLQKIQKLSLRVQGARHKYWFALTEALKQHIAADVKTEIELIWIAATRAGGNHYPGFLVSIFPLPSAARILELQPRLEKEYGVN